MRDERGQTSVLIIGFAFVLLLMVGVVVDASAAYLQRQGLDTLADGAALAGADEVRGSGVYEGGLTGERAPLDAAAARAAVHDYLLGIGAYDEHPGPVLRRRDPRPLGHRAGLRAAGPAGHRRRGHRHPGRRPRCRGRRGGQTDARI